MTSIESPFPLGCQAVFDKPPLGSREPLTSFKSIYEKESADLEMSAVPDHQSATLEGVLPMEAYALPSWYADYLPEEAILPPSVDHEYFAQAEDLSRDGNLDNGDRARLRSYLDNSPEHQKMLEHDRFKHQYQNELSEYNKILKGYLDEALAKREISGTRQYYESMILNKTTSEEVRQEVREKLMNNPRSMELMGMLGVEI